MNAPLILDAAFELDLPPSINRAFRNVRGVGRVKTNEYNAWIRGALMALVAQRAKPVQPPVALSLFIPESTRADLSNFTKATEDLLVRAGIIPDDSKKFVRSISMTFHDAPLMKVRVISLFGAA